MPRLGSVTWDGEVECGREGPDARMTPRAKLGLSPSTLVLDQDAKASWPTSCTKATAGEHVDPAVASRHP